MMWMLFLYYLGSDVINNCLGWRKRAQNQRTEPQTATQKLQWFSGPPLFVCTTLAFCVHECEYVDMFCVCSLQIQAKSVVSRTPVLGLQHLQQTCFIFVMFTFIYSCECCCLWVRAVENAFNLWKSLHLNCKCNCWHRFSLLCASYSVATQYIINVL